MPFGLAPKYLFPPAVQYVARLDGATQYWDLRDLQGIPTDIVLPVNSNFKINLNIIGGNTGFEGLLDSPDGRLWLRFLSRTQSNNLQGYVDGSYVSEFPNTESNIRDGNEHTVSIIREAGLFYLGVDGVSAETTVTDNSELSLNRLARFSTVEFGGVVKDFQVEINGALTNQIPLTNKAQGATQLATVGNVNATMINYTGDEWEVRP